MYLQELQRNWETFGKEDPLWAVASSPDKIDNGWDVDEFFKTGSGYINRIVAWMDQNGYPLQRGTALDFGCGVGRLTQALCAHFQTCVGIDIAPSMIAKAKEFNQFGPRCVYRLNEADHLGLFRKHSFDMVNTAHVLQHIRPQVALRYIQEFIRVLKPGGLAAFHCPSQRPTYAYPEGGVTCRLVCDETPRAMELGTRLTFEISVTNTCDHPIGMDAQTNAPVRLLHHWYNLETDEFHSFHGRLNLLPEILDPGATRSMTYKAASPPEPGKYVLAIQAVDYRDKPLPDQEGGQCSLPVVVTPRAAQDVRDTGLAKQRPYSETHVIPVETVRAAVESVGGRVIDVVSQQRGPGGQITSMYYATR